MDNVKELTISAIKDGTVIDHISSECTFKVAEILKLSAMDTRTVIAANLESTKLGKKGLIKISGIFLDKREVQKLALIAPNATVSAIEDYKVREKNMLKIPDELSGIVRCFNPACITNSEPMMTRFSVESKKPLILRCSHCERSMDEKDIELL